MSTSTTLFDAGQGEVSDAGLMASIDPGAFMTVIARAAADPAVDVSKIEKLWEVYRSIVQWHAERSFNAAFAEMQAELPVVTERGEIRDGAGKLRSQYAFFEDINETVKPILQAHGFSVMFKTDDSIPDRVRIVGILKHKDGYREEAPWSLPPDTSGSKSAIQASGSSSSFAKRYILIGLLNITTRGEDDDGRAGGAKTINEDQVMDLQKIITDNKIDQKAFLNALKAGNLTQIPASRFDEAKAMLERKAASMKKGSAK
jgi:hypothetical protein